MEQKQRNNRPLIVLTGPTAVGKTKLSVSLARQIHGEIISADSMQVYRHMDIGSAKITAEEMRDVPHHMINILDPWEPFNVMFFKKKCEECLQGIYERKHIPVVTGGTGFYIQALLKDIDFTENAEDSEYRASLERLARDIGAGYLHQMLLEVDPDSAGAIPVNNIKRTIRALEFYHMTGEPISEHNEREGQKSSVYQSCYFVLNDDRDRLYQRIEQRVDEMLAQGFVEEVRKLKELGCKRDMVSMQGLGYKELLAWMDGETTYEEAVRLIKRNTRHFAKRQLTWFRREENVIWIDKNEFDYDENRMLQYMLAEITATKYIV